MKFYNKPNSCRCFITSNIPIDISASAPDVLDASEWEEEASIREVAPRTQGGPTSEEPFSSSREHLPDAGGIATSVSDPIASQPSDTKDPMIATNVRLVSNETTIPCNMIECTAEPIGYRPSNCVANRQQSDMPPAVRSPQAYCLYIFGAIAVIYVSSAVC